MTSQLRGGGMGEPVAWRYRYDDPAHNDKVLGWFYDIVEPPPDAIGRSWLGWECEPLYAPPPSTSAPAEGWVSDERVEAAAKAICHFTGLAYDELPDKSKGTEEDKHWFRGLAYVALRAASPPSPSADARVVELERALRPFAEAAENVDDEAEDHWEMWESAAAMSITAGDFRRARTALTSENRHD